MKRNPYDVPDLLEGDIVVFQGITDDGQGNPILEHNGEIFHALLLETPTEVECKVGEDRVCKISCLVGEELGSEEIEIGVIYFGANIIRQGQEIWHRFAEGRTRAEVRKFMMAFRKKED